MTENTETLIVKVWNKTILKFSLEPFGLRWHICEFLVLDVCIFPFINFRSLLFQVFVPDEVIYVSMWVWIHIYVVHVCVFLLKLANEVSGRAGTGPSTERGRRKSTLSTRRVNQWNGSARTTASTISSRPHLPLFQHIVPLNKTFSNEIP